MLRCTQRILTTNPSVMEATFFKPSYSGLKLRSVIVHIRLTKTTCLIVYLPGCTENVLLSQASVFGEVVDLLNGSYSVRFLLPWVGEAQVAVRLIHSSEAVQVLKHHRETDSDRVFFNGYYEGPGLNNTRRSETVMCNVKWDKNGLERMGTEDCCCEYNDPRTGETWRCQRPKSLPCSALVYHSMGGYRNRLTKKEKILL